MKRQLVASPTYIDIYRRVRKSLAEVGNLENLGTNIISKCKNYLNCVVFDAEDTVVQGIRYEKKLVTVITV